MYVNTVIKITNVRTTTSLPSIVEIVKNLFFQENHILPIAETVKNLVISRPPHPPKVENVKNHFFQDHHIFQLENLLKISSFKTTTSSKYRKC